MRIQITRLLAALVSLAGVLHSSAQGTAFTYQGRLNDGANPATGIYDLRFTIYDAANAGAQQGALLTNAATTVTNGLFTVALDFGNQFPGADRWLEISVRTNGGGAFSALAPRQKFTGTPYAIQSVNAATATTAATAGNFSGSLSGDVTGTQSATVVGSVGGVSAANVASGANAANAAANANTAGAIVKRDGSGNFSAGTITAALSGNATTATTATSFSGSLAGNVTGTQGATVVSSVGGQSAANVASGASAANASTSANTPSTIVKRDASGNISAGTVTASFSGNGASITNVNLMNALPAYAITLTTNLTSFSGFVLDSAPLVGDTPSSMVGADVNGDGKVDLITLNRNASTLSVLTNNGSGRFALSSSPAIGSVGSGFFDQLAATDVNGDGKVDLISANYLSGNLSVLTNNGSGGFMLSSSPTTGGSPGAIEAADVNGDGKADLICANYLPDMLVTLTNNGSGGFAQAFSLSLSNRPVLLSSGEINGDSTLDLIIGNSSTNTYSIFLGTGSGSFVLQSVIKLPGSAISTAVADFNGDGKVDFVSESSLTFGFTLLTNNGAGTFSSNSTVSSIYSPASIAAADVNGDGSKDVIYGSGAVNNSKIYTNNSSGQFSLAATLPTGDNPYSLVVTDVNGDNSMDVCAANLQTAGTVSIMLNGQSYLTTTATLQGNFTGSTLSIAGTLTAGNFNGNGGSLTNLSATNLTGTIPFARLPSGIVTNNSSGVSLAGSFTGNGGGLTNLNAGNLASGTVPDARLSANVAMRNADENFAANLTISGFPIFARSLAAPTNNATLTPTGGYVKFSAVSAVTLNSTTAIASASTIGTILILEGGSDTFTVTVPNAANTRLNAAHTLGIRDTLTLLWNGTDWLELSFVNN